MRISICLFLPLAAYAVIHGGRRGPARQGAPAGAPATAPAAAPGAAKETAPVKAAVAANTTSNSSMGAAGAAPQIVGERQRHIIRICNAYTKGALNVMANFGGQQSKLTPQKIPVKGCQEVVSTVTVGDYLDFHVDGVKKSVTLPAVPLGNNVVALFVAYEKVPGQVTVWYHYFEKLKNSQVAVIDVAPPGKTLKAESPSKLMCVSGMCHVGKPETITTDSVEPLFPGRYEVSIPGENTVMTMDLAAGQSYVVMRTNQNELITFPSPSAPALQSGSAVHSLFFVAFLLALSRMA